MDVSVAEAKNRLTQLIQAAERGETIVIRRHGKPVAELRRAQQPAKRQLGTLAKKVVVRDANWWKPMTNREVEDFLAGRY